MQSSTLKVVLLILQVLLNVSCLHAVIPAGVIIDAAIEEFVELTLDINENGYDEQRDRAMKEILSAIDMEIDFRKKDQDIYEEKIKFEKLLMMMMLARLEKVYAPQIPPEIKMGNASMYEAFKIMDDQLDIIQSTIELSIRVRDHVQLEIFNNLKECTHPKYNSNPDYYFERMEKLNIIRRQVKPLRERALKLFGRLPKYNRITKKWTLAGRDEAHMSSGLIESMRTEL